MIYYGIRHKATGQLMPASKRRGYSHWNPATEVGRNPYFALPYPRLLKDRKTAQACIIQWAANPNCVPHIDFSYYGKESLRLDTTPDGRKREDLEVVKLELRVRC